MSGYASRDIAERGLLASESPFLQKPFSPERLAARVRELLDSEARRRKPTGG
jgi:DNA-binding response OmpR family regulator